MYLSARLKPPSSRKDRRSSDSGVSESSASSQSAGSRTCREAIHESLKSDRLDAGDTGEGFSAEGVRMDRLETGGVASEAEPRTSSPYARRCSASISAILKNDKFGSAYAISRSGILSCSVSDTRQTSTQGRTRNRSFSLEISRRHNRGVLWGTLTTLLSYIYAIFVVVFGGVTTVLQPFQVVGGHIIVIDDIFATVLCLLGLTWLGLLHADLCRHEKSVKRNRRSQQESNSDLSSVASDFASWTGGPTRPTFGYRYLTGRQSGSFYLKIGMTVFCCGHLIREGLLLGKEIIGWKQGGETCSDLTLMAVHVVRPVFSFYQLYFLFKYSNIVISKWIGLAKFGIMHCIATSLCFWFRTIVDDAYGDVVKGIRERAQASGDQTLLGYYTNSSCSSPDFPSPTYLAPLPYLYPFTIEFNLVLAGVWFIVLQNIRTSTRFPNLSQRRSSVDTTDKNLVISVDCHSANRGIFAGVVVLLASIVLMMIFYFTVLNGSLHRGLQPNLYPGCQHSPHNPPGRLPALHSAAVLLHLWNPGGYC
ncbi:proton channel OtopLc-like isoform X2 [Ixodes scapularis]